ncbi:MAG: type 1 glutamine amidotransferase [Acidimicrobiales bacterium]
MPTCLIVQHAPVERAYAVAAALAARGVRLDVREVFTGMSVPRSASGIDGLVVMGGPASAVSDDGFPSRRDELALLADAVRLGVPTIGICLGAQLLAAATGGRVFVGEAGPEIGWSPVELTVDSSSDLLLGGAPRRVTVLHWHGDTFSLPPGGVRLASNDRYDNQAFRVGTCAWGLQFHLEVDLAAVAAFVASFGREAAEAGSDPPSIERAAPGALDAGLAAWGRQVAERFAALVVGRVDGPHPAAGGSL